MTALNLWVLLLFLLPQFLADPAELFKILQFGRSACL